MCVCVCARAHVFSHLYARVCVCVRARGLSLCLPARVLSKSLPFYLLSMYVCVRVCVRVRVWFIFASPLSYFNSPKLHSHAYQSFKWFLRVAHPNTTHACQNYEMNSAHCPIRKTMTCGGSSRRKTKKIRRSRGYWKKNRSSRSMCLCVHVYVRVCVCVRACVN